MHISYIYQYRLHHYLFRWYIYMFWLLHPCFWRLDIPDRWPHPKSSLYCHPVYHHRVLFWMVFSVVIVSVHVLECDGCNMLNTFYTGDCYDIAYTVICTHWPLCILTIPPDNLKQLLQNYSVTAIEIWE